MGTGISPLNRARKGSAFVKCIERIPIIFVHGSLSDHFHFSTLYTQNVDKSENPVDNVDK
jgi:hypothetical protein